MAGLETAPRPVDPRTLFLPERLDLAVKLRFFRSLAGGHPDPEAERLYRRHIEARTGGREKGSPKRSVDDYVAAAAALTRSMADRGCIHVPADPIVIGSDGLPRGGAHRIACAVALGISTVPVVDHPRSGHRWDYRETAAGMSEAERLRLLRDWALAARGAALFVFWPNCREHWGAMSVAPELAEAGRIDLAFRDWNALGGLVHDLYGMAPGGALAAVADKIARLKSCAPAIRVVVAHAPGNALRAAIACKRRLRALSDMADDRHNAVHSSASAEELRYQIEVMLNPTGILHARRRSRRLPCQHDRWKAIKEAAEATGIDPRSFCLVSGMALAAAGLRDADDVDVIGEGSQRLAAAGIEINRVRKRPYHRPLPDDVAIHDPRFHYWRLGLKVISLDVIAELKGSWTSAEARRDMALIERARSR